MWGTSQVTEMDTYVTVFSLLLKLSISPLEYVGCHPSSLRNASVATQGSLSQIETTSRCCVLIELPTLPSCLLFYGCPVACLSKALRTGVVLLAISYSCLFVWLRYNIEMCFIYHKIQWFLVIFTKQCNYHHDLILGNFPTVIFVPQSGVCVTQMLPPWWMCAVATQDCLLLGLCFLSNRWHQSLWGAYLHFTCIMH